MEPKTRYIIDSMDSGGAFSFLEQVYTEYNGEEVILSNHRKAFVPGDDLSGLPDNMRAAVMDLWTADVIEAWRGAHGSGAGSQPGNGGE
jgi:hypothetical protein